MERPSEFDDIGERYLLGELSEAEQERFEESYFADDELFEQFQAVKDEMLDAYARGEFPEEKRSRFAEHFLASAPRQRELDETQKFIRAVTEVSIKTTGSAAPDATVSDTSQKSWLKSPGGFFSLRPFAWQAAFAVVLLLALAGIWLLVRNWQQPATNQDVAGHPTPLPTVAATPSGENQNILIANNNANKTTRPTPANVNKTPANANQSPAANVNTTPQAAPEKTPVREPRNLPAQVASVVLMPFATRSVSESNTLRLDSATRTVNLTLVFKDERFRSYDVTISTVGGAVVLQRKISGGSVNKSITLQFAAALLRGQDYIVTLKGTTANSQTETVGEYYFHVQRTQN